MKLQHLITIAVVILLSSLSNSCVSTYFYDLAIARNNKEFLADDPQLADFRVDPAAPIEKSWLETQPYKTVTINSYDELRLTGYYLGSPHENANTVIIAHGYSGMGLNMTNLAQFYYEELGFNVLLPDARGHGKSEGDYIGFGWHDRLDYLKWISFARELSGNESAKLVLHGVSMGGATVMMTSGENLPPYVAAIIEDCGYTSVEEQLSFQLKRTFNLGPWPFISSTSKLTKKRAGYSFDEASALEQVKINTTPMLFIHGDADGFVPYEMVQRLYDACQAEKKLYIVPEAGHGMSFNTAPELYKKQVSEFLKTYIIL